MRTDAATTRSVRSREAAGSEGVQEYAKKVSSF